MNAEVTTTPEQKTSQVSYLALAEQAGKALAVSAATLLVMSICYDFSYLKAVGLSFDEVPSLTAEHVRSAILWGPGLALAIFGAIAHELFMRRMEDGLSEEQILAKSSPAMKRFRKSSDKVPVIALVSALVGTTFFDTGYTGAYIAFILFWGLLSYSIVTHARMGVRFNRGGRVLFFGIPFVMAFVGMSGYHHGTQLIAETAPKWELTIRAGTATTKQIVTGLRRFSTFAIVVDQERYVAIIPNDSVLSARRLAKVPPLEINVCRWFSIQCLRSSSANPDLPKSTNHVAQPSGVYNGSANQIMRKTESQTSVPARTKPISPGHQ